MRERFFAKTREDGDCLVWTGGKTSRVGGYGQFWDASKRRMVLAHRVSWELVNGAIPDGMLVLHRCDNRPCVRPAHLFLGDYADNMRDMFEKGRAPVRDGARNPNARLSKSDVDVIRDRYANGETQARIAGDFGVTQTMVSAIVRGKAWKVAV